MHTRFQELTVPPAMCVCFYAAYRWRPRCGCRPVALAAVAASADGNGAQAAAHRGDALLALADAAAGVGEADGGRVAGGGRPPRVGKGQNRALTTAYDIDS